MTKNECSCPVLANSNVPPIAAGSPATIPAKIIREIPLPNFMRTLERFRDAEFQTFNNVPRTGFFRRSNPEFTESRNIEPFFLRRFDE